MSSFYLAVFILAKYHCPLSARSICKLTKPQTQLHVYWVYSLNPCMDLSAPEPKPVGIKSSNLGRM